MSRASNLAGFGSFIGPPDDLNVGIVTAVSYYGDGSSLTGIDLKDGNGTVRVQANTSGAVVTGILTATSFTGDGSGLTGVASTDYIITGTAATFTGGVDISGPSSINITGVITATTISANEFIGTGDKLIFSPTITSFSPTDGATGVSALSSPDISLTYSQPVAIGTGTITLRTGSASGTIAESYEVGVSTRVTLSTQTLTVNPTDNFDYDTEYYLVVPVGAVKNNVDGNSGILSTYSFTTEVGPAVSSVNPGFAETSVPPTTNIVFTYDKNIRAGVGTITLRTVSAGGTIAESYEVGVSTRATISTNTLTIDPTNDLDIDTTYYLVIPNNAVAGYAGTNTYSFTSLDFGFNSISPTNGETNVGLSSVITLSFTSPPTRGTGTVELRSGSVGGTLIESFNAATSPQISVSDNDWILTPSSPFNELTTIYTIIPNTAINYYVGLNTTGASSHSFTTKALGPGDAYEGGTLICQSGGTRWIVAPESSQVSRYWSSRDDANIRAQAVSGCSGWFVPSCGQLQNPGYTCRNYWATSFPYWSSTEVNAQAAWALYSTGATGTPNKNLFCGTVRSFRTVSY